MAKRAIETFNGKTFQGRTLEINMSEDNRRLFVGNIDWRWTKDDVKMYLNPVIKNIRGLLELEVKDTNDENKKK